MKISATFHQDSELIRFLQKLEGPRRCSGLAVAWAHSQQSSGFPRSAENICKKLVIFADNRANLQSTEKHDARV